MCKSKGFTHPAKTAVIMPAENAYVNWFQFHVHPFFPQTVESMSEKHTTCNNTWAPLLASLRFTISIILFGCLAWQILTHYGVLNWRCIIYYIASNICLILLYILRQISTTLIFLFDKTTRRFFPLFNELGFLAQLEFKD